MKIIVDPSSEHSKTIISINATADSALEGHGFDPDTTEYIVE